MSEKPKIPMDAPKPRLCHIIKWADFDGYGFNLHADKNKPGQYIGKVDDNSPASTALLKEGDRILEVNGVNIANENHKQAVQRIKNIPNETRLLVVDSEADRWYKEHNIVVFGDQENIVRGTSVPSTTVEEEKEEAPPTTNGDTEAPPTTNGDTDSTSKASIKDEKEDEDDRSVASAQSSSHSESSTQPQRSNSSVSEENRNNPETIAEEDKQSLTESKVEDATQNPISPVYVITLNDNDAPLYDNVVFENQNDSKLSNYTENTEVAEDCCLKKDSKLSLDDAEDKSKEINDAGSSSSENDAAVDELEKAFDRNEISEDLDKVDAKSKKDEDSSSEEGRKSPMSTTPSPPPSIESEVTNSNTTTVEKAPVTNKNSFRNGTLNLNMTAAEMRAQIAAKKKKDPRNDSLDLKKKYQIIQNM